MLHGGSNNYPMGLLDEVGSLGSLEDEDDSLGNSNMLKVPSKGFKTGRRYTNRTSELSDSQ
jgi:hypothetical protein